MTKVERVGAFLLKCKPYPICDPCIVRALRLQYGARTRPPGAAVANREGFVRTQGTCSLCDADGLVTYAP